MPTPKPVVLCILDGWGLRDDPAANAPALADTPTFDRIMASCPNATLITHGPDVGLPTGQMGNSEVGHTNIGAGRVVAMDLGQIDLAIEDGSYAGNRALGAFVDALKASGGTAHLMGVVSDGGVHGHIAHLIETVRLVAAAGVPVHICHINSSGGPLNVPLLLEMVDDLNRNHVDVTVEAYSYTAGMTRLDSGVFNPGWEAKASK